MPELSDSTFIELTHQVFDAALAERNFKFVEESRKFLWAKNGDVELIFRLETLPGQFFFSLEIVLTGALGKRATHLPYYRNLAVSTIAKFSHSNYKTPLRPPENQDQLRDAMNEQKAELLSCCMDILNGDINRWQTIVNEVIKESGWTAN